MTAKTQLLLVPLRRLAPALSLRGRIITHGRHITCLSVLLPPEENISSINVNYSMVPIIREGREGGQGGHSYRSIFLYTDSMLSCHVKKKHTRLSTIHLMCCVQEHKFVYPQGNALRTGTKKNSAADG